jgi:hypothetical protein
MLKAGEVRRLPLAAAVSWCVANAFFIQHRNLAGTLLLTKDPVAVRDPLADTLAVRVREPETLLVELRVEVGLLLLVSDPDPEALPLFVCTQWRDYCGRREEQRGVTSAARVCPHVLRPRMHCTRWSPRLPQMTMASPYQTSSAEDARNQRVGMVARRKRWLRTVPQCEH